MSKWSRATRLFFHANLLHRSDQNRSRAAPLDRCICCYNAARNNPYKEHHHPRYTPLHKVDDGAIKRAGIKFAESRAEFRERSANPPELSKRIG